MARKRFTAEEIIQNLKTAHELRRYSLASANLGGVSRSLRFHHKLHDLLRASSGRYDVFWLLSVSLRTVSCLGLLSILKLFGSLNCYEDPALAFSHLANRSY
jgi:hypothetical protein